MFQVIGIICFVIGVIIVLGGHKKIENKKGGIIKKIFSYSENKIQVYFVKWSIGLVIIIFGIYLFLL